MKNLRINLISFNLKQLKKSISLIFEHYKKQTFCFTPNSIKVKFLPKKKRYYCLLRSPHVDKCSREQFKIVIFKAILVFTNLKKDETRNFDNLELPAGVFLKVLNKG